MLGPEAGSWRVSFWTVAERRSKVIRDSAGGPSNTASNPGFRTLIRRHFLSADYGFTDSLSGRVEGSFVAIDNETPAGSRYVDGIGDTTLLLRYTLTAVPHLHEVDEATGPFGLHFGEGRLAIAAGLSLPTGDPERPSAPGLVPNSTLQTGTGTYAPLVTAVYTQTVGRSSLFAGVAAKFPGGENRFDYRVGEAFQVNLGATLPITETIDGVPKISYLYNAPDELDGKDVFASGGHIISLVPGARWRVTDRVDLEAFVEVPVFRDLRTESLEPQARFGAGLTFRF